MKQIELKRILKYSKSTGVFTWKVQNSNRVKVGQVAGCPHNRGYQQIGINGTRYLSHRLAWFYVTGEWAADIDHKNGIRIDNRFVNLRNVPHYVNGQNQKKARADNKVGLLGVSKRRNGFRAVINIEGKYHHLGDYKTPKLAYSAYLKAKRTSHVGCTI